MCGLTKVFATQSMVMEQLLEQMQTIPHMMQWWVVSSHCQSCWYTFDKQDMSTGTQGHMFVSPKTLQLLCFGILRHFSYGYVHM